MPTSAASFLFCIPADPTIGTLRAHAELGLRKLRSGRNIAGVQRVVPAYAAPTDTTTGMPIVVNGQISIPGAAAVPPTAYRYAVLIARARELAQQAVQVEQLFLSASEKRDDASYSLKKARQELALKQAQVGLQTLRVSEANDAIALAQLQQQRAEIQQKTLQDWIDRGLNEYETAMLQNYSKAAGAKRDLQNAQAIASVAKAGIEAAGAGLSGAAAAAAALAVVAQQTMSANSYGSSLIAAEEASQTATLNATHARRVEDWKLQSRLAAQDTQIGKQQVMLAQDQLAITQQEKSIAETDTSQARDTIEFLAERFTGYDLFDWMSRVLSGVYRTTLQTATATARVAQAQLAFQRQQTVPDVIKSDYWTSPSANPLASGGGADRQGLTGAERLMADILQLDQYAFDTDQRKLAITKTISLAQTYPADFYRMRETGIMVFSTPMSMFDHDFPGHYLRLIRRVRVSVIALVPPTEGIRATLANTGISRAVIGPEVFQTTVIRRPPETIALSVPIGGSGVFESDDQAEMYLPFEGGGVDGTWEFRMLKAANRIDPKVVSDVLVTYDYSALNSFDYAQSVIRDFKPTVEAERAFSLRNDFPDAWYNLHNAELLDEAERMIVQIKLARTDFPSNFEAITIRSVALHIARADRFEDEMTVKSLRLGDAGGATVAGGAARTIDGTISTQRGNGSPWLPLIGAGAGSGGRAPFGVWEINLKNANAADALKLADGLKSGAIDDILFVIGYAARTPPWPKLSA
ncbi:hypothetical protein [Methylobacterium soli]|uniref:Tc toxin complex TcA C-terminal TcB-binding domain-containing protein n=1 Tax=Methylobacterium soli TaxID=553447 RepID=A0A6L3SNW9_9HYPH|nr:hypothetical protein [Methylobacterium soli]KAB1070249.1 hypothetical protein F6X53_30325 [Methylobacterium soli]